MNTESGAVPNSENAPAPIDCQSAMRELWDYLDEELPADRTDQIRAHLATCSGCRAHVEFCRSFLSQIASPPVKQVEVDELRERVRLALRNDGLAAQASIAE